MRLDRYLTENNYYETRSKAKEAILSKDVLVNGKIKKASYEVEISDKIEIVKESNPFVSRSGLKLRKAIETFALNLKNLTILDVGSSTGGFTECSLKYGANKVYAVDVGTLQLHSKLREDSRVVSIENTNILKIEKFAEKIDLIVIDVSFVSITKLLGHLKKFSKNMIILIKPQFESGGLELKNGILKSKKMHKQILLQLEKYFATLNLSIKNLTYSPIKGKDGNIEYLVELGEKIGKYNIDKIIDEVFRG